MKFSYKLTNTNIYAHLLYRIHGDAARKLDRQELLNTLKKSVQRANKQLHHTNCNIVVHADPERTIPEEGIGGYFEQADIIRIDVDPNTKAGVANAIRTYLPGIVAHELHHARRARSVGYGKTLGEVLVTEGLAQAYQELLYPQVSLAYAHHLSADEIEKAWQRAQRGLELKKYNHSAWFFGKSKLKRWTGYSLGYALVQRYLAKHPNATSATLVDMPAGNIIKAYIR